MKRIFILALSATLIGTAFAEDKAPAASMDAKKAEMMKAWQEASTPGPEHETLKSLVGKWKVESTAWETEGGKPEKSTGTSTFKPILGGRFVQQDFKGKMGGMPYEGTGTIGFNKISKKFESTWQDSMSTATLSMEGAMDPSTKTIAESGEFYCPVRQGPQKLRSEFKIIDKNKLAFTLYMPDMVTGKEYKGMEQVYTRVK